MSYQPMIFLQRLGQGLLVLNAPSSLRAIFAELAELSARKAAGELNRRGVATPAGGKWHAVTVIRVRERLQ
jgi:hypothetical protein